LSAAETHPAARQVVEGVARNLTRGILLLSSALDPALVILGGGLGSDPRFLAIAEEALAAAEVTLPRSRPQLRSAVLGPLAGADRAADLSQGPRANKSLPPVTNPCVQFNFMANPNWWRQAAVYQIYPRSFADSNGDGLDDIRGITTKVPYLKSLGVDAVWLSPFYPSALADGGYDVDDYRNVDPRLGTLQDLDEMAAALHAAGIKLIMDIAS
jgi:predicted NBD/HSP70 family sugar kinase